MLIVNDYVKNWVEKIARICRPEEIYFCDGSQEEYEELLTLALEKGIISKVNEESYKNSYLFRNKTEDCDPDSLAKFLCTEEEIRASKHFTWKQSSSFLVEIESAFEGAMEGRVMYVVPYVMGPIHSPYAKCGIELTDSISVVLHLRKLSRIGDQAWKKIGERNHFFKSVHSRGNLQSANRFTAHFPDEKLVYTLNTEIGAYSYHPKASMSMVMGTALASKEGWLAEHMMILGIQNPEGKVHYIAGAFPSNCGKSNLAFISPPLYAKGYRCFTVSDDCAFLHLGPDGRLWAVNPDAGFYSTLSGSNKYTTPLTTEAIKEDVLFTNVSLDEENNPIWPDKEKNLPDRLTDWKGAKWEKEKSQSNPFCKDNRFCIEAEKFPSMSQYWNEPSGVPISAILFGGRSNYLDPLVREARNFEEGLFYGASVFSRKGKNEETVDRNPFGIMNFLGTSFGKYMENWFTIANALRQQPKVFRVNWFRKDESANYIWPGYKENFRVLEWIIKRLENTVEVQESAIGYIPLAKDIRIDDLALTEAHIENQLLTVDRSLWQTEIQEVAAFLRSFPSIPEALEKEIATQEINIQ